MRTWVKYVVVLFVTAGLACVVAGDVVITPINKATVPIHSFFTIKNVHDTKGKPSKLAIHGIVTHKSAAIDGTIDVLQSTCRIELGEVDDGVIVRARATGKKGDDHVPVITYDDLDAGAEGTDWMMEKIDDTNVRVYLLSNGEVAVKQGSTVVKRLTDAYYYAAFEKMGSAWKLKDYESIWDNKAASLTYQHTEQVMKKKYE